MDSLSTAKEKLEEASTRFVGGNVDGALESYKGALRALHAHTAETGGSVSACKAAFYAAYSAAMLLRRKKDFSAAEAFLKNGAYYIDYGGLVDHLSREHLEKYLALLGACKSISSSASEAELGRGDAEATRAAEDAREAIRSLRAEYF